MKIKNHTKSILVIISTFFSIINLSSQTFTFKGMIKTANNLPVANFEIIISNNGELNSIITDSQGKFEIPNLPDNVTYQLVPKKNDNPKNGVTILDVILVQRHILGIELINNPSLLIAADVNNSSTITSADMYEIRNLIVGYNKEFSNNKSWTFLPESIDVDKNNANVEHVFIVIKTGDVNFSARLN